MSVGQDTDVERGRIRCEAKKGTVARFAKIMRTRERYRPLKEQRRRGTHVGLLRTPSFRLSIAHVAV